MEFREDLPGETDTGVSDKSHEPLRHAGSVTLPLGREITPSSRRERDTSPWQGKSCRKGTS